MTNNERLTAIRARCDERGWKFVATGPVFHRANIVQKITSGVGIITGRIYDLDLLEALLAATAPGAPVMVFKEFTPVGATEPSIGIDSFEGGDVEPGTYRLVKVGDE